MSLQPGEKLSCYELLGPLGSGAMGEVWHARDTTLDREVAIKVLPDTFVQEERRVERFDREARMLAKLNHPNVSTIHGIERTNGLHFLVLEYVPGRTLEQLIAKGPIPVPEALDLLRQIAEGLEAAHEAGVVHRDLKPTNVKITPDDQVKILDFGLAKPMRRRLQAAGRPDSGHTSADGLVLGTPTYMSPEQAGGKTVDRRTDIWAFGCVAYECFTGKRAFDGENVTDIFLKLMGDDPDWSELPEDVPRPVFRLLQRMFVKDPFRRLRDVGEARLVLEHPASFELEEGTLAASRSESQGPIAAWMLAALLLVVAVLGWSRPADVVGGNDTLTHARWAFGIPLPTPCRADRLRSVGVSPDGRQVAVAVHASGASGIQLRDLASQSLRRLDGTEGVQSMAYSPDGRWIAFSDAQADQLSRVSLAGGAPQSLLPTRSDHGLAWGARGIVAPADFGRGLRVGTPEDPFEPLTSIAEGERAHAQPSLLGDVLVHSVWSHHPGSASRLVAHDLASGRSRLLNVTGNGPRLLRLPSGEVGLTWIVDDQLWGCRFDPEALRVDGDPVPLDVMVHTSSENGLALYDVGGGTLAFVPHDRSANLGRLVSVGRDGLSEPLLDADLAVAHVSVDRTGKYLALTRGGAVRAVDYVDLSLPLEERRPLAFTAGSDSAFAQISPDGSRIAYLACGDGQFQLMVEPFGRDAPARLLRTMELEPVSWSADGTRLLCEHPDGFDGSVDVWSVEVDDPSRSRALLDGPADETEPALSPDGRWLAWITDATGTPQLVVAPLDDLTEARQVSTTGACRPRWSADGDALWYRSGHAYFEVPIGSDADTLQIGPPSELFRGDFGIAGASCGFTPLPDGRFAMVQPIGTVRDELKVVVVEDFAALLQTRLNEGPPQ